MILKCLNCDNVITQTPGKRQKKFCSDLCRAKYGQRRKKVPIVESKMIDLPKDYVEIKKVGVFKPDGTIGSITEMPKGLSLIQQLEWREKHGL